MPICLLMIFSLGFYQPIVNSTEVRLRCYLHCAAHDYITNAIDNGKVNALEFLNLLSPLILLVVLSSCTVFSSH